MSGAALSIRSVEPRDLEGWDDLVLQCPGGTVFHRRGWLESACRRFGHLERSLVAIDGRDELVGVLPLAECRSLMGARAWISVPYAVYGGAVARTPELERALHAAAGERAKEARVGRLELRCREDPGLDWRPSALHEGFHRELPREVEEVLAGMPKKARADVRRARREHGLTLEEGRWYLPDLVRLFQRNKQDLGTPALPLGWFEDLLASCGDETFVHVVRHGADVLAAVMSFGYRGELHAYYSGTTADADRAYKASSFLYCALQEWAIERGYRRFDFGRSRVDSGAHAFKRRQGFEPAALGYRFLLVRDQGLPTLNPSNPRTERIQRTWSQLPRDLATPLGGYLSRFLP